MDYSMPEMNGLEAARHLSDLRYPQDLKKCGVSPDLRFVLDALILRLRLFLSKTR
jgi:CheY-like chemotaxis protein